MQFMERHRIIIAFGIALAGHACVFWWWGEKPAVEDNEPAASLDLVLTQVSRPDERVQPDQDIEEFEDSEVMPDPVSEAPSEPEVISQPAAAREALSTPLNMTRPDNWAEVGPTPDVAEDGTAEDFARAFRGEFYARLEQRQTSKARSRLLSGRRVAQRGLSADQYNALELPGSGHYKSAAGCFDFKSDIVGAISAGQRAWIAACKDLIRSPFELPSVEFDALGRAVVP